MSTGTLLASVAATRLRSPCTSPRGAVFSFDSYCSGMAVSLAGVATQDVVEGLAGAQSLRARGSRLASVADRNRVRLLPGPPIHSHRVGPPKTWTHLYRKLF